MYAISMKATQFTYKKLRYHPPLLLPLPQLPLLPPLLLLVPLMQLLSFFS